MHSHTLSLSFASKWRQMQLLSPARDEEEAHDKECWVTAQKITTDYLNTKQQQPKQYEAKTFYLK